MMVRTRTHKYAHYADGSAELYDLVSDPNEIENLVGTDTVSGIETDLKACLLKHTLSRQAAHSRYVDAAQYWSASTSKLTINAPA